MARRQQSSMFSARPIATAVIEVCNRQTSIIGQDSGVSRLFHRDNRASCFKDDVLRS